MGWLRNIRDNIKAALVENPEYLVWHVAECTFEEVFTFKFEHSDMDVVTAAAAVFNRVADEVPEDVLVLFENLWWPGLRLIEPGIVDRFFCGLKKQNVGIMLDTGHLMNTNISLSNELEAVSFICQTVENLGMYKNYIHGMHLSCSLSGSYQKHSCKAVPESCSMTEIMHHVTSIDQHLIFKESGLKSLIECIEPSYLVHELFYDNLAELSVLVQTQQKLLLK